MQKAETSGSTRPPCWLLFSIIGSGAFCGLSFFMSIRTGGMEGGSWWLILYPLFLCIFVILAISVPMGFIVDGIMNRFRK